MNSAFSLSRAARPYWRHVNLGLMAYLVAAPLLVMPPARAFAQHSKDLADASLEELMNIEVYSASKHLQKAEQAPSSVTVITAEEIRTYGYRTLADILRTVRSFYITYDRNYSYVGVRGLGRPGDFNTRILLLIDGHRLNDNVYDQAMIGTEFPLDIDLIERVEIIRGPVSSLYGANAFFGVINVITRKGADRKGIEVSSEAASFGTYQGRISFGGQHGKFQYFASGSFLGSHGHTRLFYSEFNTPQNNYGYALHADDDQLGSGLITVRLRDFTFQSLYGNRDKGIPTASYATVFNAPGTRTTDSHAYFDLSYQHTFARRWEVRARGFYDRYAYRGTYEFQNSLGAVNPNFDFADGKWWGSELQVTRQLARHRVTIGGEYRDNFHQNQSNYDTNPYYLYLDDRRHSFTGATFLQDEWAITSKLTLNAGLRYDYYNRPQSSTNPRAALIYQPWRGTALKFVYGTAFRIPNVYELYYGVPGTVPSLTLRPEKIRTIEMVWEQRIRQNVGLTASVYHNRIKDLISQVQLPDSSFTLRNLSRAHSTGLELELDGKLAGGLQGKISYVMQETIDPLTSEELSNSPDHLVKINVNTPVFTRHFLAGMDAQYTSARSTLAGQKVAGFPMFNFTLLGRNLGKNAELSASVYNLLDRRYFDPGGAELRQFAIQQDGRSFRLKLTWTWAGPK